MQSVTTVDPTQKVNRAFAEKVAQENAQKWGFSYIDLEQFPINADFAKLIPETEARAAGIIVFEKKGKTLRVAVDKPGNENAKKIAEKFETAGYELQFFVCSPEGLASAFSVYQSGLVQKKSVELSNIVDESQGSLEPNLPRFTALEKQVRQIAIGTLLNEIYLLAVASKASDIHFQPSKDGMKVRLRTNGVLREVLQIPLDVSQKIIPQLKYDGGMKSNITESPQDGRIEFNANDRMIELRVSTLPMKPFESVVMRVLDSRRGIKSFSELGFPAHLETKINTVLQQKNGIILVTGPTGSGKTTTLYSMLKELNTADRKLVTLEDPIEYHLSGVSQSQVDELHEYNFESGFKSLLRHDPDVILVGEIRTMPTAKLAFEAALTGHTVLSSLHTNSSIGAISRLRNMGMENYNIAPTINAVFAQKLLRTIGTKTQIKEEPLSEVMKKNPRIFASIERIKKVFPKQEIPKTIPVDVIGENAFFTGMTVICEAFVLNDEIREMILHNDSEIQIKQYLDEYTDYLSMFENGLIKVLNKETTLVELMRVT